jgi:hypothetical protein
VSIFSDLNQIQDLTLNPEYAGLCGLTQEEVEKYFEPEIAVILEKTKKTRETYLADLKEYYNGYRFSREPLTLYNPFGLLYHFAEKGEFNPYWYETGTPTFLINMIKSQNLDILHLGDMSFGMSQFQKFDIERLDAKVILYQSGYLTISNFDIEKNKFYLDYPNLEVRSSFATSLIEQYLSTDTRNSDALINKLPDTLSDGDVEGMIDVLRSFLATVPYDIIRDAENYYQTVFHLIFSMLGLDCRSELRIAHGRIDAKVETTKYIYLFEFKFNGSAKEALEQINEKDYPLPWKTGEKKIFKIGVNFDGEKRNISEWVVG